MFRILLRKSCQVAMRPRVSNDLFWLLCIFLTWSVGLLPDYLQIFEQPANWKRNSSLFLGSTGATWSYGQKAFASSFHILEIRLADRWS